MYAHLSSLPLVKFLLFSPFGRPNIRAGTTHRHSLISFSPAPHRPTATSSPPPPAKSPLQHAETRLKSPGSTSYKPLATEVVWRNSSLDATSPTARQNLSLRVGETRRFAHSHGIAKLIARPAEYTTGDTFPGLLWRKNGTEMLRLHSHHATATRYYFSRCPSRVGLRFYCKRSALGYRVRLPGYCGGHGEVRAVSNWQNEGYRGAGDLARSIKLKAQAAHVLPWRLFLGFCSRCLSELFRRERVLVRFSRPWLRKRRHLPVFHWVSNAAFQALRARV